MSTQMSEGGKRVISVVYALDAVVEAGHFTRWAILWIAA
jgi:hypothetical protein